MTAPDRQQRCPACAGPNGCALAAGQPAQFCWCMQSDPRLALPLRSDASCYCKSCLSQRAGADREPLRDR